MQVSQVTFSALIDPAPGPGPGRAIALGNDTVLALLSLPAVQLAAAAQRGRLGEAVGAVLVQELVARDVAQARGLRDGLPEEVALIVRLGGRGAGGAPVVLGEAGPPALPEGVLQGQVRHSPRALAVQVPAGARAQALLEAALAQERVVVLPGPQRRPLLQAGGGLALAGQVQRVVGARAARPPRPVRAEGAGVVAGRAPPPRAFAHGRDPGAVGPRQLAARHAGVEVEALMHAAAGRPVPVAEGGAELVQAALHVLVLLRRQQAAHRLGAAELHGRVERAQGAQLLRHVHARVLAEVGHGEARQVLLALGAAVRGEACGERTGPWRLIWTGCGASECSSIRVAACGRAVDTSEPGKGAGSFSPRAAGSAHLGTPAEMHPHTWLVNSCGGSAKLSGAPWASWGCCCSV